MQMEAFECWNKLKLTLYSARTCTVLYRMLAFDIETTGLDAGSHEVTVICCEDFFTGQKYTFEYARTRKLGALAVDQLTTELIRLLDNATSLCAFNGIRFDLPFMHRALGLSDATVTGWIVKTSDILECSRLIYGQTFSLNLLCECNGMPMKSGTGLQAISLAFNEQWEELNAYCADDVSILCNLYRHRHITHPRTRASIDLAAWSHPLLYSTTQGTAKVADEYCPQFDEENDSSTIADEIEIVNASDDDGASSAVCSLDD